MPTSVPSEINIEMFLSELNLFTNSYNYTPIALDRVDHIGEIIHIIYTPLYNPFD
jgi:hypothetical protein